MGMIRRNLKRRAAENVAHDQDNFSQFMNPPEEPLPFSDVEFEEPKAYTKTEINRMSTAELKSFATEQGIENAEDMTGAELKKVLIEKFRL